MQLKIAMLSVHSCPLGKLGRENTGGMSVYIRELCRELGRRGHLVDIYTRAHEPVYDQIVKLGKNARLIHLKAGQEEEIEKLAIYPHLADFAGEVENFRKQNELRYDLIHSHYWLSGWVGKWIQRWWNIPHITMLHTLGAVKNAIGIGKREPDLRINSEKVLIKDCHRIIAPTDREKEYLIHYYDASPELISVIPCGVNLDLFKSVEKETARGHLGLDSDGIILFVGRIVPLKGIDKLLMAMPYLENGQRLQLLVIGGDEDCRDEVERLKNLSHSLQMHDSVTFPGLVKQERLPLFYSAADLCVFPSYYESFGLVALESLACGTPVVATKVGCMENVIRQGETGYVVIDNAPHRLADKIALLLSMSKKKREVTSSIRGSITQFSWSNIADAIVNEYMAVIGNYLARV
ncbi:MAG: glycosyltransferase family 1 protein [Desulfobacteraceae bacterium]|nr:MAG: glycosyltransferase family 1 protein [Desulfobacteraceae bacterium]